MITKLDILKQAVGLVVGAGVSQIVGSIVANNVATENTVQKVTVFAGKTGIAMVVNDMVRKHTDSQIDAAASWVRENVKK